jgi:hypothetical protein
MLNDITDNGEAGTGWGADVCAMARDRSRESRVMGVPERGRPRGIIHPAFAARCGFALPRLQSRHSPLVARLVLWAFWATWHAPAYFGGFAARSLEDTLLEWAFMLPVTMVFTGLCDRARAHVRSDLAVDDRKHRRDLCCSLALRYVHDSRTCCG